MAVLVAADGGVEMALGEGARTALRRADVRREPVAFSALSRAARNVSRSSNGSAGATLSEDLVTGSRKVSFDFGEDGLPLDRLGDIAERGREILGEERPCAGGRKVGRNEPCPCGSGRKFKKCCGR